MLLPTVLNNVIAVVLKIKIDLLAILIPALELGIISHMWIFRMYIFVPSHKKDSIYCGQDQYKVLLFRLPVAQRFFTNVFAIVASHLRQSNITICP